MHDTPKIMFFDIDGTLVPEDGDRSIPESTVKALAMAREAGNLLFINTGRPVFNVSDDLRALGFDGYVCGCGTYLEYGGKEIFYKTVPRELCLRTRDILRECRAVPMFERRDCVFFDRRARALPLIEGIREGFAAQGNDVSRHADEEDFSFDKFIFSYDADTDLERLLRELDRDYFCIDRGSSFYEIVPRPCSKASGIEAVLGYFGIPKSRSYAIGDSLNDLPMFEAAGTSIAMGNGAMLIPYADYVTDDIREDGIYNALEKMGFFEHSVHSEAAL